MTCGLILIMETTQVTFQGVVRNREVDIEMAGPQLDQNPVTLAVGN